MVLAPIVRQTTVKLSLAIGSKQDLNIKHYQAKKAFLNGESAKYVAYSQQGD